MKDFGIDVSRWQGNFNFKKAISEGVKFAIIKCGGADGGLYTDPKFARNYAECEKLNIPVGAYYFGNANSVAEAKKEAEHCISIIKGRKFAYPIFYDVESARMDVGKGTLNSIITTFCTELEKAGYWAGFYTNYNWYKNKCNGADLAKRYSLWLASWGDKCPTSDAQIWQFGGETNLIRTNKVAGVTCDQNYSFKDFPSHIKSMGLNGFSSITRKFTGFNQQRRKDFLIIYTNSYGTKTKTNLFGREVRVDKNGYILDDPQYGHCNKEIPKGGFVISGHGEGSVWLKNNVKKGMTASYNSDTYMLTIK